MHDFLNYTFEQSLGNIAKTTGKSYAIFWQSCVIFIVIFIKRSYRSEEYKN